MFSSKKKEGISSSSLSQKITSLVGSGTSIAGDVHFDNGGLRIEGTIKGSIESSNKDSFVYITENAVVEGSVNAGHIVINGKVIGPVKALNFLELQPKAEVLGDLEYANMEIRLGAIVHGKMSHLTANSNENPTSEKS